MRYSKTTKGFYPEDIDYPNLPADCVTIDQAAYDALMYAQTPAGGSKQIQADANGYPVAVDPAAPTQEEEIAIVTRALQAEMDRRAQAKGYDNILSAVSYAQQPSGAAFQAEGAAFLQWRSDVWSQAYATLAKVQAGTATLPTPDEAVAQMPALVLP